MRLEVKGRDGHGAVGTLIAKDTSFLFLRGDDGSIQICPWDNIPENGILRITPKGKTVVNVRVE